MIKNFGAIVFFLISLQGFYFESIGFSPFSLIGVLGLLLMSVLKIKSNFRAINNSKKKFLIPIIYATFFSTAIMASFYYNDSIDVKRVLGFVLVLILAFFAIIFFEKVDLIFAIQLTLGIHSIFFLIQFLGFYIFGINVDYLQMVTGSTQKGLGGGFYHETLGEFRRFGGLFSEPGTYSTFVAPLAAMLARSYNRYKLSKIVVNLSLLTLVLSFSTFGVIFSVMIVFWILFIHKIRSSYFIILSTIIGLAYAIPYFYNRFVVRQIAGSDTGVEFRFQFLNEVIDYIFSGWFQILFGTGLLDTNLSNKINITAAVNDSSLFLYLVLSIGPFAAFAFFFILFFSLAKLDSFSALAFLILCMSKASLFWPYIPVVFVAMFYGGRIKNRRAIPII